MCKCLHVDGALHCCWRSANFDFFVNSNSVYNQVAADADSGTTEARRDFQVWAHLSSTFLATESGVLRRASRMCSGEMYVTPERLHSCRTERDVMFKRYAAAAVVMHMQAQVRQHPSQKRSRSLLPRTSGERPC